MSVIYTNGKLIARVLLYAFLAFLVLMFFHSYLVIRKERVSTRISVLMTEGQNELVASLPAGHFQIRFTQEPNVNPAVVVPAEPVLQ